MQAWTASSTVSAFAMAAATDSIRPTKAESVANGIPPRGANAGASTGASDTADDLRPLARWATVAAVAPAPTKAAMWARRFGLFEVPDICTGSSEPVLKSLVACREVAFQLGPDLAPGAVQEHPL